MRHKDRWAQFAASLRDWETVKASAERYMVADTTAFRWRHRFLQAVKVGAVRLRGFVEADETFFLRSHRGVATNCLDSYLRWFHLAVLPKHQALRVILAAAAGILPVTRHA